MRDVALTGLELSGKSTVFNAVARAHAATGGGAQKANVAVVSVPDERVDRLAEMHASRKTVHGQVRLIDLPGFSARSLGEARAADALAVVLRAFGGDADPARDLATFRAELALADVATLEKALERTRKQTRVNPTPEAKAELEAYERAEAVLGSDRWLREEAWEPADLRWLQLLTPFTIKPVLHVVNLDETRPAETGVPEPRIAIRGLLEAEAAELDPGDAAELMAEFGLTESATARFIRSVYDLLDLVTFLTTGEDETRAWEIARGAKAPQAGGAIHSDLERGFIRAEVVSYDDLVAAGSWDKAREAGRLRLEGKDYDVREGDVLHIRHSG